MFSNLCLFVYHHLPRSESSLDMPGWFRATVLVYLINTCLYKNLRIQKIRKIITHLQCPLHQLHQVHLCLPFHHGILQVPPHPWAQCHLWSRHYHHCLYYQGNHRCQHHLKDFHDFISFCKYVIITDYFLVIAQHSH